MACVPPELASAQQGMESLLDGIGDLLTSLLEGPGQSEELTDEQPHTLIDQQLQQFFQHYYCLRTRHHESHLSVAVLALTKSGKSTLLNALTSSEILPCNNVPETARICKLVHDVAANEPELHEGSQKVLRGEKAVRTRLSQLNCDARCSDSGAANTGAPSSSSSPSLPLEIRASITALEPYKGQAFGKLTLLDTPGPNEAGEERLRFQVERLLDSVDAVLYLLDYTKLKTADEADLFKRLHRINPQLVARLSSRLFFVVNKVDAMDTSEGLDAEETRQYVADLVTRQLGGAGMGFRLAPEQVVLISARNALLARLVLAGRASPDTLKRFNRLAFGAFPGAAARATPEAVTAAAQAMLDESGVVDLEVRVLTYLAAHAASVKMLATIDDCVRLLQEVQNVAVSCRACLQRRADELAAEAGGLRGEVQDTLNAFDGAMADTHAVQAEITAEIRAHLNALRTRLFSYIIHTLDVDAPQPPHMGAPPPPPPHHQAAGGADRHHGTGDGSHHHRHRHHHGRHRHRHRRSSSHSGRASGSGSGGEAQPEPPRADAGGGAEQQQQQQAAATTATGTGASTSTSSSSSSSSRWRRLREKFLSLFTSASSASTSTLGCARSRSREELALLLSDLHDDLLGQIHSEVGEFWHVLEAITSGRHAELLARLNTHLGEVSRRVEGVVASRLAVELSPADIRLRLPSAEEFHSNIQALINNGIAETQEKHIRVGTRQATERVLQFRGGLCKWGAYWVDVPRTRTVVETYSVTVYELRPEQVANHFIQLVDSAIGASERALEAYVAAYMAEQLRAARERIQEYSDRYLGAMSAALDTSNRGAEHRQAALAQVEAYLARLAGLMQEATRLQRAAEACVPQLADAEPYEEVFMYDDDDAEQEGEEGGDEDEVTAEEQEEGNEGGAAGRDALAVEVEQQQQQQHGGSTSGEVTDGGGSMHSLAEAAAATAPAAAAAADPGVVSHQQQENCGGGGRALDELFGAMMAHVDDPRQAGRQLLPYMRVPLPASSEASTGNASASPAAVGATDDMGLVQAMAAAATVAAAAAAQGSAATQPDTLTAEAHGLQASRASTSMSPDACALAGSSVPEEDAAKQPHAESLSAPGASGMVFAWQAQQQQQQQQQHSSPHERYVMMQALPDVPVSVAGGNVTAPDGTPAAAAAMPAEPLAEPSTPHSDELPTLEACMGYGSSPDAMVAAAAAGTNLVDFGSPASDVAPHVMYDDIMPFVYDDSSFMRAMSMGGSRLDTPEPGTGPRQQQEQEDTAAVTGAGAGSAVGSKAARGQQQSVLQQQQVLVSPRSASSDDWMLVARDDEDAEMEAAADGRHVLNALSGSHA